MIRRIERSQTSIPSQRELSCRGLERLKLKCCRVPACEFTGAERRVERDVPGAFPGRNACATPKQRALRSRSTGAAAPSSIWPRFKLNCSRLRSCLLRSRSQRRIFDSSATRPVSRVRAFQEDMPECRTSRHHHLSPGSKLDGYFSRTRNCRVTHTSSGGRHRGALAALRDTALLPIGRDLRGECEREVVERGVFLRC
jgi:hypothetical protein